MLARVSRALALPCLLALLSSCGGPSVELNDDTLAVVHVSPSHGSVEVRRDPTITLGFSDALVEGSLQDNLTLFAQDDGGGTRAVEARVFLDETGRVATVIPSGVLEGATLHRVVIAEGLRATTGASLNVPYRAEFVTRAE